MRNRDSAARLEADEATGACGGNGDGDLLGSGVAGDGGGDDGDAACSMHGGGPGGR